MPLVTAVDDLQLLQQWMQGDQRSAHLLVRRHHASIFRFFEVKAPRVAEDLTQRTFLAFFEHAQRFEGRSSVRAFLFGIARNHWLRHLRAPDRLDLGARFDAVPKEQRSLSSVVVGQDEQRLLLLALEALTPDQRIAIELYYWEGLRTAEIGEVLGIQKTAVTTRLMRARDRLRQAILTTTHATPARDRLAGDLEGWTRSMVSGNPSPPPPPDVTWTKHGQEV